jgi:hypothetical protein
MSSETNTNKSKRRGHLAAKVKQLDWIFSWAVRIHPCAICNRSLLDGFDPRYPGKSVTLHHTNGSREEDTWDNLEYVAGMVFCHSKCHRSYHLKRRHAEAGKKVDLASLTRMEDNIRSAVERQKQMVHNMSP